MASAFSSSRRTAKSRKDSFNMNFSVFNQQANMLSRWLLHYRSTKYEDLPWKAFLQVKRYIHLHVQNHLTHRFYFSEELSFYFLKCFIFFKNMIFLFQLRLLHIQQRQQKQQVSSNLSNRHISYSIIIFQQ